jgi:hypothetical protein
VLMWNVLLSAVLAAGVPEFEAQTLDGQTAVGQIAQFDGQQLVLETAQGRSTFTLAALATLARKPAAPASEKKANLWIELIDQSGLAAVEYTVHGLTALVTLTTGVTVEVPTRVVRWVRFGAVADRDPKVTKQWSEITETKTAGDLLVLRKNGALDYLEGVQGDIDAETCKFELDKETIPVKRPKVEGVVYFHSNTAELPATVGQVFAADGSRLAMQAAALDAGSVKLSTPAGVSLSLPLEEVARFDFSSGKIAYLSDLQPESATYVPLLDLKAQPAALREFYQYRRDVGFEQNPLRLDGKVYRKGLSLQSRTVLAYRLPGKFRLFKGIVGIDDSVRETGDVRVEIKGDGKTLWQGDVRGSDPARELELDVAGVKRLEIVVDYGAGQDIGDRLDVCEARVTK